MTSTREMVPATGSATPHRTNTTASASAIVAPPNAAERKPERVTPICTAERNRLGLPVRRSMARPRLPRPASCRTWLSRRVIRAISAAAKVPPMTMKTAMRAMSVSTWPDSSVSGR